MDQDQIPSHLPAVSFSDFGQWDLQPFNELFVRDRLRRRIEQNKLKYSKIGIVAQSVPLRVEIESIRSLLLCGGTVGEVRMSRNAQSLSVIVSYSKLSARATTKSVAEMGDDELDRILSKYNDLRRTTLINGPCILCGIYDYYFLQFLVSIVRRAEAQRIEQDLFRFITKSLIYCVVMDDVGSFDVLRDTTLDLLNFEALHSLLMALNRSFIPCARCTAQHGLSGSAQSAQRIPREWISKVLNVLIRHGLNLRKMVKNAALEQECAVMNRFNFQWIELRQIIMIQLLHHPMATNPDDDRYGEFVVIWTRFYDHLLVERHRMRTALSDEDGDHDGRGQAECDRMALEIQLTVFESTLKAVIGRTFLLQIIAFLAHKRAEAEGIWTDYDLLIMLLFCGHFEGFHALRRRTKYGRSGRTLGAFHEMLSLSNVIPSNLHSIGRIIAVRSLQFQCQYDSEWTQQYAVQFVQCLLCIFYDHDLYDFGADEAERASTAPTLSRNEYTEKLPESVVVDGDGDGDGINDGAESDGVDLKQSGSSGAELDEAECVRMISEGLRSHKMFLMECAFVNEEILRCLMELRLLDREYILERFRNTFDFMQFERGIDAKERWQRLRDGVFVYNDNVFLFRRMKEKELRLLFRAMIRVVVVREFRDWVNDCIESGIRSEEDIERAIKIEKRGEIEDRYKMSIKTMRLIQSFV